MKAIRIAHSEGKDCRRELTKFLIGHRSTPHSSTGATPFFLMYGREMRTKLPDLCREQTVLDEATRDKDWANKLKGKAYADSKRCAQESSIEVGDQVLVRVPKLNKLSSNFDPVPRAVIAKDGGQLTIERDGTSLRRHSSHCKPYQRSDDSELPLNSADSGNSDNDRDSSMDSDAARKNVSSEVNVPPVSCERNAVPSERSLRPRSNLKQPSKLRDYVCSCDIR